MGIEARNGGAIKAVNCLIVENQFHGVAIGPRGIGYISGNTIEGNGHEGIWCGGIAEEICRMWRTVQLFISIKDPSPSDKAPPPPHLSRMQDSKYTIPPEEVGRNLSLLIM
jgi:hypothetical protein